MWKPSQHAGLASSQMCPPHPDITFPHLLEVQTHYRICVAHWCPGGFRRVDDTACGLLRQHFLSM